MISDEFKTELHEVLALDTDAILDNRKRPKKGQALSAEEAAHVNQVLKAYAANAGRTKEEMIEMRDFVNAVRAFYRVDLRDNEQKGELVLSPPNYNRWAKDFENYKLLDVDSVILVDVEPPTMAESKMQILGMEWD